MKGIVTNYKFYESNSLISNESGHFYEIKTEKDLYYYVQSNSNDYLVTTYGAELQIKLDNFMNNAKDISGGLPLIVPSNPILGPYTKRVNVVNYQGFILDCLNSDFGVYNLDNEIILFGSGCLKIQAIGTARITFYNLHLIPMEEMSWIIKLFGRSLKNSKHILVYCPAFSSYSFNNEKEVDEIFYENVISTKSNFASLLYAHFWIKNNLNIEISFKGLDELASILIDTNPINCSIFEGHCQSCVYIDNFSDLWDFFSSKQIIEAGHIKKIFHNIKSRLLKSAIYSNQVLSQVSWLKNQILFGTIHRKTSVLFEFKSGDSSISIYCNDLKFNPPTDNINNKILIFNPFKIVEIIPKLKCANSWTTKAYLWISPITKVWCSFGYLWTPLNYNNKSNSTSNNNANFIENLPGFVKCKIIRKYFILRDFEGHQFETAVIHVESSKGPRCFHLNPIEKFYAILPENTKYDDIITDKIDEMFLIRYFIKESYFNDSTDSIPILSASSIVPTITCDLLLNKKLIKGAIQVKLSDLPYLPYLKGEGVQFFSLQLRFYSPTSLVFQLICSKCQKLITAGRCLTHFETFIPLLTVSAVFETADAEGNSCNVLIDQFSVFEIISSLNSSVKNRLIEILKTSGQVKLNSEHFLFINSIKSEPISTIENVVAQLMPRISKLCLCTFPVNMANSVLRPTSLEICDTKLEILTLLNYFNLSEKEKERLKN